jgi:diguanylate cyclase (GGDEF)-like protein/PAS domain S-box-containing protein
MENQLPAIASRRRSERVSIAFSLEASGTDARGVRFRDKTKTSTVSRFGCCVSLPRMLPLKHQISLHRLGTGERAVGQIVAQMGAHSEGYLYGVATSESCEGIWGIRFCSPLLQQLPDSSYDGIYIVNRDRKITYWNEAAERLTGYSANESVGKQCFSNFLDDVDECGNRMCDTACPLNKAMTDGEPTEAEFFLRHKDGYRVPVSLRILPMRNSAQEVVGAVEVFTDTTAKDRARKRRRELENASFRDPVTRLPNCRYMELKVAQALEEHKQFDREYGLVLLDLDRFQQVNDAHGRDTGDALLRTVAETLQHTMRAADVVGRWGSEEFMVLITDLNAMALGDLAERSRVLIAQSSVMNGTSRVSLTASIGATLLNHTDTAESAIRRTEELMTQSKNAGGDRTTAG